MAYYSKYNYILKLPDTDNTFTALIFNRLTGGISILSKDEYEIISCFSPGSTVKEETLGLFLTSLKEAKFVLSSKEEEDKLYKNLYNQQMRDKFTTPIQFHLALTYGCNFACKYCFESEVTNKNAEYMSTDVFNSAKKYIKKYVSNHNIATEEVNISLFGGEPLLNSQKAMGLVLDILEFVQDEGYQFSVSTNGYNLDTFIPVFQKYKNNLEGIQVTIDGLPEYHNTIRVKQNGEGTFNVIVKNITKALEGGLKINLRLNLDNNNIDSLPAIFELFDGYGWFNYEGLGMNLGVIKNYHLEVSEYFNSEYSYDISEKIFMACQHAENINSEYARYLSPFLYGLESIYKRGVLPPPVLSGCGAGLHELALDPEGKLYPCAPALGRSEWCIGTYHPEESNGNITLEEIRNRNVDTIEHCKECNVKLLCGGGCAINSKKRTNIICSPDCRPIENTLKNGIKYLWPKLKTNIFSYYFNGKCCDRGGNDE